MLRMPAFGPLQALKSRQCFGDFMPAIEMSPRPLGDVCAPCCDNDTAVRPVLQKLQCVFRSNRVFVFEERLVICRAQSERIEHPIRSAAELSRECLAAANRRVIFEMCCCGRIQADRRQCRKRSVPRNVEAIPICAVIGKCGFALLVVNIGSFECQVE